MNMNFDTAEFNEISGSESSMRSIDLNAKRITNEDESPITPSLSIDLDTSRTITAEYKFISGTLNAEIFPKTNIGITIQLVPQPVEILGIAEPVENLGHRLMFNLPSIPRVIPTGDIEETINIYQVPINSFINFIQSSYNVLVPSMNNVANYLSDYPNLKRIVTISLEDINSLFEDEVQLSLEMFNDNENEDEFLILYIRQEKYNSNIMSEIDKIRANYQPLLKDSSGYYLVTTDFQLPINNEL